MILSWTETKRIIKGFVYFTPRDRLLSCTGSVQKIATIFPGVFKDFSRIKLNFQGPPTRNVISQMVYKSTFPVQASRFLIRLQVFAPSPSLHFSVHLPFLSISCLNTRVLQCLKLLYTGKEYQSLYKALSF